MLSDFLFLYLSSVSSQAIKLACLYNEEISPIVPQFVKFNSSLSRAQLTPPNKTLIVTISTMIIYSLKKIRLREEKSTWSKCPCGAWWFEAAAASHLKIFNEACIISCIVKAARNVRNIILPFL